MNRPGPARAPEFLWRAAATPVTGVVALVRMVVGDSLNYCLFTNSVPFGLEEKTPPSGRLGLIFRLGYGQLHGGCAHQVGVEIYDSQAQGVISSLQVQRTLAGKIALHDLLVDAGL